MPQLQQLILYSNSISGALPNEWSMAMMVNIQVLFLANNQLTGTLPVDWKAMVNIQQLYLGDNQLTGTLPVDWQALKQLQELSVNENKLEGPIDDALVSAWNAANMTVANLGFNFFTGRVPALCNLQRLDASHNQFSGGQPSDLACMTKVTRVFLSYNLLEWDLSDLLWQTFRTLNQTVIIDVSHNSMRGDAASFYFLNRWVQASNAGLTPLQETSDTLFSLSAGSNYVSGAISPNMLSPSGFPGAFTGLNNVDLSDNLLTGPVPDAFAGLPSGFNLTGNPAMRNEDTVTSSNPLLLLPSFLNSNGTSSTTLANVTNIHHHNAFKSNLACPALRVTRTSALVELDPVYFNYSVCECALNFYWSSGSQCVAIPDTPGPTGSLVPKFQRKGPVGQQQFRLTEGLFPVTFMDVNLSSGNASNVTTNNVETSQGYLYPHPAQGSVVHDMVLVCYSEQNCNPLPSTQVQAGNQTWASFSCATGSGYLLCSRCLRGYYSSGSTCLPCKDSLNGTATVVLACMALLALMAYAWSNFSPDSQSGLFPITMFFLQSLAILRDTRAAQGLIGHHSHMHHLFNAAHVTLLKTPTLQCVWQEFDLTWLVGVSCSMLGIITLVCLPTLVVRQPKKTIRLGIYLLNIAYTPVVSALFQWMNCTPLLSGHSGGGVVRFHTLSPYLQCHEGWRWGVGLPFMLLYAVGFPVMVVIHVCRPDTAWTRDLDLRFMYKMYRLQRLPRFWPCGLSAHDPEEGAVVKRPWWVGIVFLRRFLTTGAMTAFAYDSRAGMLALFVTLVGSALMQSFARPFIRDGDNILDVSTMLVLTATLEVGVLGLQTLRGSEMGSLVTFIFVINAAMIALLGVAVVRDNRSALKRCGLVLGSRHASSSDAVGDESHIEEGIDLPSMATNRLSGLFEPLPRAQTASNAADSDLVELHLHPEPPEAFPVSTIRKLEQQLHEKEVQLQERDAQLHEKEEQLQESRSQLQESRRQVQERDAQLHESRSQLQESQQQLQVSRGQLQERDAQLRRHNEEVRRLHAAQRPTHNGD